MMPIEPANAVSRVRAFFVIRLCSDRLMAVAKLMDVCSLTLTVTGADVSDSVQGLSSPTILPSSRRTVRVAYFDASSGLCVTMMMSLSFAISCSRFMICTLVSLSSAPVGSSASRMSGLLTMARAMATRCIWPPDIWFGALSSWSPRPTFSSASTARARRSSPETPESVSASSTLASTLWCGMRL